MVVLLAVGAMNVTWMIVIATLVVAQKLLPPMDAIDGHQTKGGNND